MGSTGTAWQGHPVSDKAKKVGLTPVFLEPVSEVASSRQTIADCRFGMNSTRQTKRGPDSLPSIKDSPQITRDFDHAVFEFLVIEVKLGLTLANSAIRNAAGSQARKFNAENAQTAYEVIVKLSEKFRLTTEQAAEIGSGLQRLRKVLRELGL